MFTTHSISNRRSTHIISLYKNSYNSAKPFYFAPIPFVNFTRICNHTQSDRQPSYRPRDAVNTHNAPIKQLDFALSGHG